MVTKNLMMESSNGPIASLPPTRNYECVLHPFPQDYKESELDITWSSQYLNNYEAVTLAELEGDGKKWKKSFGEHFGNDAVSRTRGLCSFVSKQVISGALTQGAAGYRLPHIVYKKWHTVSSGESSCRIMPRRM